MLQCKRCRALSQLQCAIAVRRSNLFDDAETEDADEDQVERDDVVQKPRHNEDEHAGNERDDGLKMADAEGHGFSPFGDGR